MTIHEEEKMTIHEATTGILFDGKPYCYRIGFINGDGDEDETELTALAREELEELWESLREDLGCETDEVLYVERVEPQIFVVDILDTNEYGQNYTAATFAVRIFDSGDFSNSDVRRMIAEASRDYLNVTAKKVDTFTYMDFYRNVSNEICRDHGFEVMAPWERKKSNWKAVKDNTIVLNWLDNLIETKTFSASIECFATIVCNVKVPAYMSKREAAQYVKKHLNEIDLEKGEVKPIEAYHLNEEECDFCK